MESLVELGDRIARRLGYVKAHPKETPQGEKICGAPADCEAAPVFDYHKAINQKDWAYFYEEGDAFYYAIGKPDWMPAVLAGLLVGHNHLDALDIFGHAIQRRLWLDQKSGLYQRWVSDNQHVFHDASLLDISDADREAAFRHESADVFLPEMFTSLPAMIVALELRTAWQRMNTARPDVLGTTNVHCLLMNLPIYRSAVEAPRLAFQQLLDWTVDWMSARGLEVDRQHMLVKVDGYRPLVFVDGDPVRF